MSVERDLIAKAEARTAVFGVIGLGYVGLPLTVELAATGYRVIGFDLNRRVVDGVNAGRSHILDVPSERLGSRSRSIAPQGCYRCAGGDEWCAISVLNDDQWEALVAEIGDEAPELRSPRFATLAGRLDHHDEIDAAIESWTSVEL